LLHYIFILCQSLLSVRLEPDIVDIRATIDGKVAKTTWKGLAWTKKMHRLAAKVEKVKDANS